MTSHNSLLSDSSHCLLLLQKWQEINSAITAGTEALIKNINTDTHSLEVGPCPTLEALLHCTGGDQVLGAV